MSPSIIHGPDGPSQNIVEGNLIGTDVNGTVAIPNAGAGVNITNANSNTIGGATSNARNVISGNSFGVAISGNAQSNHIQGNFIGTKINGTEPLGNSLDGVRVDDSTGNVIGVSVDPNTSTVSGAGNLISGNLQNGVNLEIVSTGANGNFVAGNLIGTDVSGTKSLPNTSNGLVINGSSDNLIGGTTSAARNIISGNGDGIYLTSAATGNTVEGNYIGTNKDGSGSLPNGNGLYINGAAKNFIGGSTGTTAGGSCTGACNVISGNGANGVFVIGGDATGNLISGNFIGLTANGKAPLGNHGTAGVTLSAPKNTVGGTASGAGNVISANTRGVVLALNSDATNVQGNFIGTASSGNVSLGNVGPGIRMEDSGSHVIGGTTTGARNVISGNGAEGVDIEGGSGDIVQGNFIGTNAAGTASLGNGEIGVYIINGHDHKVGGTTSGAHNVIAFNGSSGVVVFEANANMAFNDSILGNSIFGNGKLGIDLGDNGVTANDSVDGDPGANLLQNFPVITAAQVVNSSLSVAGTLKSVPNTTYRIEVFGNSASDASGFGEGQIFIGAANATTAGNGNASFKATFSYPAGVVKLSATATDPNGNTSEFSADRAVILPPPTPTPTPRPTPTTTATPGVTPSTSPSPTATARPTATAKPTPTATPVAAVLNLLNISTRMEVLSGNNVLIGGFIITGNEPKKVMIRALGPSLPVSGNLADPVLELHDKTGVIATNDNWKINDKTGRSQQTEIEATTIPPKSDLEAALIASLPANNSAYTAVVRGKNGGTGVGQVEVYDLGATANSQLANISTRGFVDTGDNVMIGGVIVGPNSAGSTKVLLRAIGPSLGISGALSDPILELHNGNGATIATNDNWKIDDKTGASQQAEIEATQAPPKSDFESALIHTVTPGNYTAIVRGKHETTGIGLVEIYNLQ
jgi:hypothetical protein